MPPIYWKQLRTLVSCASCIACQSLPGCISFTALFGSAFENSFLDALSFALSVKSNLVPIPSLFCLLWLLKLSMVCESGCPRPGGDADMPGCVNCPRLEDEPLVEEATGRMDN